MTPPMRLKTLKISSDLNEVLRYFEEAHLLYLFWVSVSVQK